MNAHVAAALAAIEHGNDATALEQLLAAWADLRSPTIARIVALVDRCANGFDATEPSPDPGDVDQLLAASVIERGPLLRQIVSIGGEEVTDHDRWLGALLQLPPDPRITNILSPLSERLPLAWIETDNQMDEPELDLADPTSALFRRVYERHRDAGYLAHGKPALRPPWDKLDDESERVLGDAEMTLRRRLFDDAGDREVAPCTNAREELAAYADWLTRRGDPRGALIAFGPEAWPECPSLYALRELWLGPLDRFAYAPIETGVVRKVRFHDDKRTPSEIVDWRAAEVGWRPGWCAVEHLEDPPAELLNTIDLPALRVLGCTRDRIVAAIEAGADLTDLDILAPRGWFKGEPSRHDVRGMQEFLRAPQLRGLRGLKLHSYSDDRDAIRRLVEVFSELLADPCGLETMTVYTSSRNWIWVPAPEWLAALRATASPLRRFRATGAGGEYWIFGHATSGIDWQSVRVEWWGSSPNNFTAERIADVARAGAKSIQLAAKQVLTPGMLALVRGFDCELTIEIDPSLGLDQLETA